jgi:hypothetical protein
MATALERVADNQLMFDTVERQWQAYINAVPRR